MIPQHIRKAVVDLRNKAGMPVDINVRGPVQLDILFNSTPVSHTTLESLSLSTAVQHLLQEGYINNAETVIDLLEDHTLLEGLMYWCAGDGVAFIRAGGYLPRRRFTAAHELGHALLHQETMGRYLADAKINEGDSPENEREREANQFAVELLMPEELLHARAEEMQRDFGACPRTILVYRLSSELLVSRETLRYRLMNLGVGNDE